jgi:hypothetical protein
MSPYGNYLYVGLIVAALGACWRVPKWQREVIFVDDLGRPHYGRKLHYLVGLAALVLVLTGHMCLSRFTAYAVWLMDSRLEAGKAGWFCFTTVGGFLLKPTQTVAGFMLKPSQTRRVRLVCGMASGFGLGVLIVRYLPFLNQ